MFCSRCGTQNNDAYTNCVNCGAPLGAPQYPQQQYQQPPQQPNYGYGQPYYGYAQAPVNAVNGPKPTVLYIIAGVMAVISFVLVFLPSFFYGSHAYNPFSIVGESFKASSYTYSSSRSASNVWAGIAGLVITMFVIPMGLQVAWAILSFMQKRPAGVFGIISSGIYFISSFIWAIVCAAGTSASSGYSITPVPGLMIMLAIAGIPVSIVQLVKKKYL